MVTLPFPGYFFISYFLGNASISFGNLINPKVRTSKSGFTLFINCPADKYQDDEGYVNVKIGRAHV